jgi:membrane protease YdiL (CAAX protease family)
VLRKRIRAVLFAAGLVAWSFVAPRLRARWLVPVQATLSAGLVASVSAPLGLRPPPVWRGLRQGLAAAGLVAAGVAAAAPVPRVRADMAARELPSPAGWLLVRIPVGTVWSEEAAFRAALGTAAADAFGSRWGRLLQASAFGLSHIADARGAGEPVIPTVVVTGAAGWVFAWLYERSGSLLAPMLAHLAVNESGAVAALLIQRQTSRASARS